MLRASIEATGKEASLSGVLGDRAEETVHAGAILVAFAGALVRRDAGLAAARTAIQERLGDAALVDAAGTAANFQRMVRIADGTGIPLDERMAAASAELRPALQIDRFQRS